jgi:hypothetical protein
VTNSLRSINTLKDVNQESESLKSMKKINGMNLQKIVNNKIKKIHKVIDKNQQLQAIMHKYVILKHNSINILIGKRERGKTFNFCQEVLKICQLPQCAGFTSFVIVSDKPNESTVNELLPLITIKVIKADYDHAYDLLNEIMDGKTAYDKVIRENLDDNITDESKEKILNKAVDDHLYDKLPHAIVLLDDAMNILGKKKHEKLYNLLYRNRQPRFVICACIQDSTGVQYHFKRNSDNIWIFGGN